MNSASGLALSLRLRFFMEPAFLLFLAPRQLSWFLLCYSMACESTLDLGLH